MTTSINQISKDTPLEEIILLLKTVMKKKKKSQAAIAKAIDVSPTAINQLLKNKYRGDTETLKCKIIDYLNIEHKRSQSRRMKIDFSETNQALEVFAVCNYCHIHKTIGLIHGPAGLGKTMALKEYARDNSQVIYMACNATVLPQALLRELLTKIGSEPKGREHKLLQDFIDCISGTEKLIIVDEAQHLRLNLFDPLRHINDEAEVGIVFSGNNSILQRMTGRHNQEYDQVYSRVEIRRELSAKPSYEDIEAILDAYKIEYDGKIVKMLQKKATDRGHYRSMRNVLRVAQEIANQVPRELTAQDLVMAEKMTFNFGANSA